MSSGQISDCHDLQVEEWQVLESIYPDWVTKDRQECIKFEIPIDFGSSRTVCIANDDHALRESANLQVLPPLLLHMSLPSSYPLSSPPHIISIRAMHLWMPHVVRLQQSLLDMWHKESVLYDWVEFVRAGDFLTSVDMISHSETNRILIPYPAPHLLLPLLTAYEASYKCSQFSENSYACSICLEYFKGAHCILLSCGHAFCRSCLEDFWKMCIREGDVLRVGCPDPECVKEKREANEEEVARVVTSEEVQRWRWLRDKVAMEKDPTILHCPMSFCQAPVRKPDIKEGEDSAWDRLRTCTACSYSFCSFCKRTWHGPVNFCPISASEELVLKYLAFDEGSHDRHLIEARFGRSNVLRLVARYQEEQLNKAWLESSTMACPGCEVKVEKSLGCNHMQCAKCQVHFCYRCGSKLLASNPYAHFSVPGQSCYYKLFDGEANPGYGDV